jgi:hypothetical protein
MILAMTRLSLIGIIVGIAYDKLLAKIVSFPLPSRVRERV